MKNYILVEKNLISIFIYLLFHFINNPVCLRKKNIEYDEKSHIKKI